MIKSLDFEKQKALARIHSHICGDGCLYTFLQNRSPSSIRTSRSVKPFRNYVVEYDNNESGLLDEFERDIKSVFGREHYIYCGEKTRKIRNKRIYFLLKEMGCGKSREWKIPLVILNSLTLSKEWFRAFFDDEGTLDTSDRHKRARIKSVNLKGLKQASLLLKNLGIENSITGPNKDNTWYLTTNDLLKFHKNFQLIHPKKSRLLKEIIMRQAGISG